MAETLAVDDPLSSLPIPPFSPSIFTNDLALPDDYLSFDYEDLGISFDNEHNPSDAEEIFNSTFNQSGTVNRSFLESEFNDFVADLETVIPESGDLSGNHELNVSGSGLFNIPSPDDDFLCFNETVKSVKVLENSSPESRNENPVSSQGSGNCGSDGSEAVTISPSRDSGNCRPEAATISPSRDSGNCRSDGSEAATISASRDSGNSSVNPNTNLETASNFVLKRKKERSEANLESTTTKHRKSNESATTTGNGNQINEDEMRKKARLIRNRESAQLSRQRKKQYVEELEDKVRSMQATIQDLNARLVYITAENTTLKQQMFAGAAAAAAGGAAAGSGGGAVFPPPVIYPWIPYPPYAIKSQNSKLPLLPIPKLKTKTKKLASISFLGLFLFVMLFGGLLPIMNVKFGKPSSNYLDKFNDYKLYNQEHHHGRRVLTGDEHHEHVNRTSYNSSEPLVASLYVPRNNKLVKIDGNLIISSVLASEKAMAVASTQQRMTKKEDADYLVPAISTSTVKRIQSDGNPQQWFRERISGSMLSSGMCTEVFQFDASVSSGAIVPATATSASNITATETRHNSTAITTLKNRRILHGLPLTNITKEHVAGHEDRHRNGSVSSMVVSVLVDPREAGDGGDVGGGKGGSFSRIFVVVLLDSVKYVTYSCMLPVKGSSHLVKG